MFNDGNSRDLSRSSLNLIPPSVFIRPDFQISQIKEFENQDEYSLPQNKMKNYILPTAKKSRYTSDRRINHTKDVDVFNYI